MKIRLRELLKIVNEELSKDDAEPKEGDASLDAQVDRYFVRYEEESRRPKKESFRRRRIIEAEDDAPADEPSDSSEPQKMTSSDIDVEVFANSVVRLIENYDALLEVRSTIARRAINYLAKEYDEETIELFKATLEDDHGLVPGETEQETNASHTRPPQADKAQGPAPGVT